MRELTGEYKLMSGERDGHALPPDHIHNSAVRFTADSVVVSDRDDNKSYAASYRLDTKTQPWRITMTATEAPNAGEVSEGLVEQQGNTVRLIYALPGHPAPSDLHTKPGELLFVLEKRNT